MSQSNSNKSLNAVVEGLPIKYSDYGFNGIDENNENGRFIKLYKNYFIEGEIKIKDVTKKSLLFTGSVGTGKTRLAVATLRNMRPKKVKSVSKFYNGRLRPHESIYLLADKFFNKMNESAAQGGKEKTINEFLKYDIVLLDDLSFENFSTSKQENLYLLINEVYLQEKTIFLTTNFTFEKLRMIEPRVADRLNEMCFIMEFKGKSFRE